MSLSSFRFANFKSFRTEAELRLASADGQPISVLGIYGANASGKSNVAFALAYMRWFVLNCAKSTSADAIRTFPFKLDAESLDTSSLFEVAIGLDGRRYRYGFTITTQRVEAEWLIADGDCASRPETVMFIRDEDVVEGTVAGVSDLAKRTRGNMLLLAKLDQDNDALAHQMMVWFRDLTIFTGLNDEASYGYSHQAFFSGDQSDLLDFMRHADPTIVGAVENARPMTTDEIGALPPEVRKQAVQQAAYAAQIAFTRRASDSRQVNVPFSFAQDESAGTQKMFCLSAPIMDILRRGLTAVIDEIDSKLHPNLTRHIVGLFQSPSTNPHGAQLVFVGHATGLMKSAGLTNEQICFCEKNKLGESYLYKLDQFKGNEGFVPASLEEDYLNGDFGAVPYERALRHVED